MNRSEAEEIVQSAAARHVLRLYAQHGEFEDESSKTKAKKIERALAVLDAPNPRDALLAEAREVVDTLLRVGNHGDAAEAVADEFLTKLKKAGR